MTKKQLIEILVQCEDDAEIYVISNHGECKVTSARKDQEGDVIIYFHDLP